MEKATERVIVMLLSAILAEIRTVGDAHRPPSEAKLLSRTAINNTLKEYTKMVKGEKD